MVGFGVILYGFSVYATDEAAGADFSKTALSLAYGGSVFVGGLLAIPVGRFADNHGVRIIVGLGAVLGFLGLAAFSLANQSWQVVAAWWVFLGPAQAMIYYEPAYVAIDQWSAPRDRARTLATITLIGGLAGIVFIPLTAGLVSALGWRPAVLLLGILLLAVGGATAVFCIAPSPRRRGLTEGTGWCGVIDVGVHPRSSVPAVHGGADAHAPRDPGCHHAPSRQIRGGRFPAEHGCAAGGRRVGDESARPMDRPEACRSIWSESGPGNHRGDRCAQRLADGGRHVEVADDRALPAVRSGVRRPPSHAGNGHGRLVLRADLRKDHGDSMDGRRPRWGERTRDRRRVARCHRRSTRHRLLSLRRFSWSRRSPSWQADARTLARCSAIAVGRRSPRVLAADGSLVAVVVLVRIGSADASVGDSKCCSDRHAHGDPHRIRRQRKQNSTEGGAERDTYTDAGFRGFLVSHRSDSMAPHHVRIGVGGRRTWTFRVGWSGERGSGRGGCDLVPWPGPVSGRTMVGVGSAYETWR